MNSYCDYVCDSCSREHCPYEPTEMPSDEEINEIERRFWQGESLTDL